MAFKENVWKNEKLVQIIKAEGVVVMPTDTIYGIVGMAQSEFVVNRIYNIRNRDLKKPCIILIGDVSELEKFSIILNDVQKNKLQEYWKVGERPTSVILDCSDANLEYLHRGTQSLAFRLPQSSQLRELLLETGPLIAPSANTEKSIESKNTEEAKNYFGDKVDMYVDGGEISGKASRVIRLSKEGLAEIVRE
jgi:L-threonylcarbamoyladenylate synthase